MVFWMDLEWCCNLVPSPVSLTCCCWLDSLNGPWTWFTTWPSLGWLMDPVAITCSTYTSQMLQDCSVVSEVTVCVQVTLDSQVFTSHETVLVLLSDLRRKHLSYTYKEFSAFQPHLLSYHSAHPRVFSTLLSDSGKNQLDLLSALLQAEHRSQPSNHTSGVCWTCSNLSMPFSH